MKRIWTLLLTACLLLGWSVPALAVPVAYTVTVQTGSSSYLQGNTVSASGHVAYGAEAAPGVTVTWSVLTAGGGSTYQAGQTTTNASGDYTLSFMLPSDAATGSWSLAVAAAGKDASASFTVTTPPPPPPPSPPPTPNPPPPPAQPGAPATVSITSGSSLTSGASLKLTANAIDADGKTTATTFTWTVENGTGSATLAGTTLTGVKAGTVTAKATAANGVTGLKAITVAPGAASSMSITSAGSVMMGATLTLSATVKDAAGNVLDSPAVAWSVTSGTGFASVSGKVLTPTAAGNVTVKGTSGAASATMTVNITAQNGTSPDGNTAASNQATPDGAVVGAGPVVVDATGNVSINFHASDLAKEGTALVYYWNGAHWIAVPTAYTPAGATATVPGGAPVVLMTSTARQFADTHSSWANTDILKLQSLGLLSGDGTGNYHPTDAVDRFSIAKMMALAAGLNVTTPDMTKLNALPDKDRVPEWARPYVAAVLNAALMNGTDAGFAGQAPLTRAQAATTLGRILPAGSPLADLTFTDTSKIPSWATEGVRKAVGAGLMNGLPGNIFAPNEPMSREQLAAVISRLLEKLEIR